MLNAITIQGRCVADPELKSTQQGTSVATVTVAVDRDFADTERETDFINVVAWRKSGEFLARNFQKGKMIVVSGRLQSRKWQDRDGNNRVNWEVVAENIYFCGDKKKTEEGTFTGKPARVDASTFEDLPGGEDGLPF